MLAGAAVPSTNHATQISSNADRHSQYPSQGQDTASEQKRKSGAEWYNGGGPGLIQWKLLHPPPPSDLFTDSDVVEGYGCEGGVKPTYSIDSARG
jgi:hypothetical protein